MKNLSNKIGMFSWYICTIVWIFNTVENYHDKKDQVQLVLQYLVILISLVNSIVATVRYKNKVKNHKKL